jgi:DNA-binding transcriptional LysR family regulator
LCGEGGRKLGIGFSTSLAAGRMRALILELIQTLPGVQLSGFERGRRRLSQALYAGTIDFAVLSGDSVLEAMTRKALWRRAHDDRAPSRPFLRLNKCIVPRLGTWAFALRRQRSHVRIVSGAPSAKVSQTAPPVRRCIAFNCPGTRLSNSTLSVLNDEPYAPGRPG